MPKAISTVPDTALLSRGAKSLLGMVTILVVAGAAGLAVAGLPLGIALGGVGVPAAVAIFSLTRLALAPSFAAIVGRMEPISADALSGSLRIPRFLYYGGLLCLAQLTFRLPLNFTLSDWLFLAALGLTVIELLAVHRRFAIGMPLLMFLGALLFAVGTLLSSLDAAHPVQSLAVGARFVYMVTVWFWLGSVLLRTSNQVATAVRLWTVSAAITGGGAVAQVMWGDVIPSTSPTWGRMTGFTPHANELGGVTALALVPALWAAAQPHSSGPRRVASLVVVGFIGTGLILSGSVGSFLAAAVAIGLWLALGAIRLRTIGVVAVAAGISVMLGVGILEQAGITSPLDRVERVTESQGEEGSLWSRLDGYGAAWEVITRNPVIGVGLDDESSRTNVIGLELRTDGTAVYARHQVHNMLLGTWYAAGLLGLLGVLAILVSVLRAGVLTVLRANSQDERFLAASLLANYGGFVVFALSTVALYQRYGWIGAVLLLALWAQQSRRA